MLQASPNRGSTASHLSFADQVNRGAFYTPARYVALVGEWLVKHGVAMDCTILEPSCGYGAFFALNRWMPDARFIGNDIDPDAVAVDPAKLDWYCYVDVFKSIAATPYWMGNLNVPLVAADFPAVAPSFRRISLHRHPEVFGPSPEPSDYDRSLARSYVQNAISFRPCHRKESIRA